MEVKNIYSNVCMLFMVEESDSEKPEASKKASIFAFCHTMSHRSLSHHGRKVAYINILSKSYVSFYISICKLTQPGHIPRPRRRYYRRASRPPRITDWYRVVQHGGDQIFWGIYNKMGL